jgi:hypothetical protein
MDAHRFDRLVLTLTRASSRRSALGVLSALGLTVLAARDVAAIPCGQRATLPAGQRLLLRPLHTQTGHKQEVLPPGFGPGHLHDRVQYLHLHPHLLPRSRHEP